MQNLISNLFFVCNHRTVNDVRCAGYTNFDMRQFSALLDLLFVPLCILYRRRCIPHQGPSIYYVSIYMDFFSPTNSLVQHTYSTECQKKLPLSEPTQSSWWCNTYMNGPLSSHGGRQSINLIQSQTTFRFDLSFCGGVSGLKEQINNWAIVLFSQFYIKC